MKHILIYCNSMKPSGGIERVISTLSNILCNKMKATILVKDDPISFYPLNNNICLKSLNVANDFDMNNRFKRLFQVIFSNYRSIKKLKLINFNQFDFIYIVHPSNALEIYLAQGRHYDRLICSEHGGNNAYNFIYKQIKKWLYPKTRAYVVPTTTDLKFYQKTGIKNTTHIPHFKSRMNYEQSKLDKRIALNIGRFTDAKQQNLLINI